MRTRLFYLEDDEALGFLTKDNLEEKGFDVVHCQSGSLAMETFTSDQFDICILDIMLPEVDGFTVAKQIRQQDNDIPIIFLSAKSLKEDRIEGFKIGADDFMVKPFSIEELVCRIHVFLRRKDKVYAANRQINSPVMLGKFIFNYEALSLKFEKEQFELTRREADLLQLFVKHPNQIIAREEILKQLWGDDDYFKGRSLDVFISRLRKLFKADEGIQLENIHGVGFRLKIV